LNPKRKPAPNNTCHFDRREKSFLNAISSNAKTDFFIGLARWTLE
jgi:hypothetical protein